VNEKQTNDKRLHAILVIAVFVIVLGGFFVLNRVITPPAVSESERRPLATLPELTADSFASAEYMGDFETWAADSFALRESLRTLRAETVFRAFLQSDKSGLYLGDSGAGKFDKIREDAWRRSCAKIRILAERLSEQNVYAAFVPDKSIYAGKWMPGFDENLARRIFAEELPDLTQIDLAGALTGEDFYRTDLHWSQTQLAGVMDALGAGMGFIPPVRMAFAPPDRADEVQTAGQFLGVYAGQLAMPMPPDYLTYVPLTDASVRVTYLDPASGVMIEGPLYDFSALSGGDPYNFFLKGPQPLIVLETSHNGRELILFRDSFGSSLAPLFLGPYSKVTLIDLRYIDSRILDQHVTFPPGADVLFLYSSQVLNNPDILLIK
jgi:hypothetical protein